MSENLERIRVDKWLCFSRFFKTHSISRKYIKSVGIRINQNKKFKPSTEISVGDVLTFNVGSSVKVVEVLSCGSGRVSTTETGLLYNEMYSQKNQIMNPVS